MSADLFMAVECVCLCCDVTEEGCERHALSLWLIFLFFYRNGDGFVDREEFGEILHLTGEAVTEEDIDEMFGESDTNKDGKIDFDGKTWLHI